MLLCGKESGPFQAFLEYQRSAQNEEALCHPTEIEFISAPLLSSNNTHLADSPDANMKRSFFPNIWSINIQIAIVITALNQMFNDVEAVASTAWGNKLRPESVTIYK